MTTHGLRTISGRLVPALLSFLSLAVPAVAAIEDWSGPLYLSAESIGAAQRLLVTDGYLRAGAYAGGELDEGTSGAIRAFQRDHFIQQHGLLDPETMGMLTGHRPGALETGTRSSATAPRAAGEPAFDAPAAGRDAWDEPRREPAEAGRVPRSMPATASPIPLITGLGSLLLATGLALLLGRRR